MTSIDAVVLGGGRMGQAITYDMANRDAVETVLITDVVAEHLSAIRDRFDGSVETFELDASDQTALTELLADRDVDVAVDALPYELSVPALESCVAADTDAVSLTYTDPQWDLDAPATEAGVTIVPGCGVAPGLSNLLIGYAGGGLDTVTDIEVKVGGLPADPKPPLEYRVVFSLASVWREYDVPARIIRNGEYTETEPLSGIETIEFEGVGELECFYTRGVSTLPETFGDVETLEEKTIRYPGHARKIKTLKECGLLDTDPIAIGDHEIAPREFLTALLEPKLELGDAHDLTVMRVTVSGTVDGAAETREYELLDRYETAT
ncbi:MAG: saccharopine dehydrogenase C-terminal domain-containing protein, partial [Halobacteriales archaeon]|nr:saccharopine dehydrogenase C-terminal domain-containing protein [Halobacteriales archaeon]